MGIEQMGAPFFIDVFMAPIRESSVTQVAIMAVLLLMALDIVFGVANALMHHSFSSERMREGIGHKCASLGFMVVGVIIDGTIIGGVDLGFSAPVLTTICVYLCIMEIGSLLEIFAKMNPDLGNSPVFKLLKETKNK